MLTYRRRMLVGLVACVAIGAPVVFGLVSAPQNASAGPRGTSPQNADASTSGPEFKYDVASIKPNTSGNDRSSWAATPDRFTATNVTLMSLFQMAYKQADSPAAGLRRDLISGAPNWLESERYDIEAKADDSVADEVEKLSPAERRLAMLHMMQQLLVDRFNLKVHRRTKESSVYLLVIAKDGPKLKEAQPGKASSQKGTPSLPPPDAAMQTRTRTFSAAPISRLVDFLTAVVGRPVIDRTGLTGKYTFTLQWTPSNNPMHPLAGDTRNDMRVLPASDSGSVFTAVQEQLGLKLEPGKDPVEMIVIDHVEKPSEN